MMEKGDNLCSIVSLEQSSQLLYFCFILKLGKAL